MVNSCLNNNSILNKTFVQLFEEQVTRTPHDIALVYQHQELSYHALNQAANQVARSIQKHLIAPDTLVAICVDRSFELFIGLIAILKTGSAYVPIDPNTPADRMRFMLEDANTRLLLTHESRIDKLLSSLPTTITVCTLESLSCQAEEKCNLNINFAATSLAYVIYTSGTTGYPKGVMITHRNIINYCANISPYFDGIDNIDFSTSLAFDLTVTTTLIPLLCGKKIIIYPGDLNDSEQYIAHLQKENIHFIKSTPSYLAQLFSLPQSTRIKTCFVGGEKIQPPQLQSLLNHVDHVFDEYGPTENTVGTMLVEKKADFSNIASIGKPYSNHQVYVLDDNREPVQMGVIGELYIGGAQLAQGYLNQPVLTKERFILNPFATELERAFGYTRLYQTGDLVKWLPDGNIEFIGRNDFQVKIRGFRIELSEIEYTLSRYHSIQQCVVLAFPDNILAAFYLSDHAVNEETLIAYLRQWLPEYMLPLVFIHMTAFPLTLNGKVDRNALHLENIPLTRERYLAPSTTLEYLLCDIWQDILGIKPIGMLDDFFKLGGDSIKSMQVIASLLRKGFNCRVRDLYTHRCIQLLSMVIEKTRTINAELGILTGEIKLHPVQTWFFEQAFPQINHWNQSFLVRVPPLDIERLNQILPQLVEHHDMLRVCFPLDNDGNRQQNYGVKKINFTLKQIDVSECVETLTDWQKNFDIEQGPLWQIGYISGYSDGSARLYFSFHHLIIDSVSWRILINDIKRLYAGERLGDKQSSYRQWTNIIHHYAEKYPEEYDYWKNAVARTKRLSRVRGFTATSRTRERRLVRATATFDANITQQIIGPANNAYHTEVNDLLLTALALTLCAYFKRPSFCITLEGHGREEIDDTIDISQTIGWFTSMYPVILTAQDDIAKSIQSLKEYLRSIPHKGIGYGAFQLLPNLPHITFNYLGQFDTPSGYWQVVSEPAGKSVHVNNERPHSLDITGQVINGTLHFSLSSYLSEEAARQIALIFKQQLLAVTTHCMAQVQNAFALFTPSDFTFVKLNSHLLNQLQQENNNIEAIYAANSLQQGFIYHAISEPEDSAYRVQMLLDYYHPLNVEAYQDAWRLAIATYPILRTYFNWDESVIQIVNKYGQLNIQWHDLTDSLDKEHALAEIQIHDRLVTFDLTKPTLMRLHLIKMNADHFVLLKTTHHSILDGWSASILLNQVHRYYAVLLQQKKCDVILDKTFHHAQAYIANHRVDAEGYWSRQLQTIDHINDLNLLLSYPTHLDAIKTLKSPQQVMVHETGESYQALKKCVNTQGLTINIVVQFAFHKLIQIYTGDTQTIVGTTISGRTLPIAGIDKSVGLYINTLPLIIHWDETSCVLQLLRLFESQLANLNEYSFVDLASLQKEGHRLFHSLYIAEQAPSVDIYQSRETIETLDYPLALIVYEDNDGLKLRLKYDEMLLTDTKAQQLLSQLRLILDQLPHKILAAHHEISLLTANDYQQIIYDWNNTPVFFPDEKTIHRLFERQAAKTPDAIALIFKSKTLTYRALNNAANQLAQQLLRDYKNKAPNTLITLFFEHSFEMVISLLAILKSGAVYVPIDPETQTVRLLGILKETKSRLILTLPHLVEKLKQVILPDVNIIPVNHSLYFQENTVNLPDACQATDLAYVIYTSGTTGSPKGVMISHKNVVNYISSITHNESYMSAKLIDCSSSIAFDAAVAVLLAPLVIGHCVVLCQENIKRDTSLYLDHIKKQAIDLIRLTPSYLSALLITHEPLSLREALSSVRCLILGGERANAADIRAWMTLIPTCRVINHYGPTETTVACALYTIHDLNEVLQLDNIPLGRAAHNHQFYVLDQFLHPVPVGVVGELYVGGAGVSRGYLNKSALTQSCFIANPFANISDQTRLYKTGDLVRWLPDGHLEFIGRHDFQVKIRGFRIELSEIEQVLLLYPPLQQCVVVVHDKQTAQGLDAQLIAYYVSTSIVPPSVLKHHLESYLPYYMIPAVFMALDVLPLTLNGKLNRKALPAPLWNEDAKQYTAPRDELESLLCTLWQDILAVERISVHDDFFKLGGHSILAMHVAHRVSKALHRHVAVADIFKYKTIADICTVLRTGADLLDIAPVAKTMAPLSFAQERLWFIEQYEGGTEFYHIPLLFELDANTNVCALKEALQAIINRHEILRTVFIQDEEGVYQQQVKGEPLEIVEKEISELLFPLQRQSLIQKPFDLTKEYPIRVCLFHLDDNSSSFLMIIFHHIAFDAWSKNIFMTELDYFYQADSMPILNVQYNDFAIWQRNVVAQHSAVLLGYWREKLKAHEPLHFPTDYPRPLNLDYRGKAVHLLLSKELSVKIKQLATSHGVTLYTVLLTGFTVLLSKYTGQDDLIIGTPTANRQHTQLAGLIGFFVNLLPLRIQLTTDYTFLQLLHVIHTNVIEAQCHQDIPFSSLVEDLKLSRETSRHPLFQILFNVEYAGAACKTKLNLKPIPIESDEQSAKLDLSISIQDNEAGLAARLQYATSLFKHQTIIRIAAHYERVLTDMVESLDKRINTYSILTPDEYKQMIYDWNATDQDYPRDKTIHQLFEEQVMRTPGKIAVVDENEQLTYQALNERANQLARCIRKQIKNTPDALIVFCLDRSLNMIISLLGILKAGAAYVPLEPHYPIDRIRYVLNDTKSALLLTEAHLAPLLKEACPAHTQLLIINRHHEHDREEDKHNLSAVARSHHLAYVIYTSGTSGLPKGVMVTHSSLTNIVHHLPKQLGLTENSHVLQFASIAFDASVLQIFNTLTNGCKLFIVSEAMRQDAAALASYLQHHKISYAGIPPALLRHLDPKAYPDLKQLVVAGEAANGEIMAEWCVGRCLINAYGPTENTVGIALHHYEKGDSITNIGRPLANVKVYILDQQLMPVPIGVTGELHVAGAGVARGYLNKSELTQNCFIANPFASGADLAHGYTRLYKTGDLARWLPDGNLEFVGRHDFQVKIRGFRIELSEIEQVLRLHTKVEDCVVVACHKRQTECADLQLAAYYVSASEVPPSVLIAHLESYLPDYMIPTVFMALDALPLTINGKLNRKALPTPVWSDETAQYAAPRDELESLICTIWQDALTIERAGIYDDFFRLGGHSILAIHVTHRMSQASGRQLTVADIFKHRTIAALCTVLRTEDYLEDIPPVAMTMAPLSFAQARLWFIEQYEEGTDAYHIPLLFELDNSIQMDALKQALQAIVNRHEILRTVFVKDRLGIYQQQVKNAPLVIIEEKIDPSTFLQQRETLLQKSFCLTTEYPIRICLFKAEIAPSFLMVIFHHVAFDAWSKNIFIAELDYFYQTAIDKNKFTLPILNIQYNDFAIWQRDRVTERSHSLLAYWQEKCRGHESLSFPTDYPRPLMMDYRGDIVSIEIPAVLLEQLKSLTHTHHVTLYTILLSGFALLLSKYTGQTDILIGTPVVNRQHPQLNHLIGLFVNSIVLRIAVQPTDSIAAYFLKLQQDLIEAQRHQDLPFEQLVNHLHLPRDTSKHPLFQMMFTVQHQDEAIGKWVPVDLANASQTAKFDLAVSIQTSKIKTTVSLQYAKSLFKHETMALFLTRYERVLNEIVSDPKKQLSQCQLLSPTEYSQIVYDWNSTASDYPEAETLHTLFAAQAKKTPDNSAVIYEEQQLTYRQLDEKSNQLACFIRRSSVRAEDTFIVICLPRSLDLMIGLLGILKSAAAYVPIDPDSPKVRIEYILKDTACSLILTHKKFSSLFQNTDIQVVFLDEVPYQHESVASLPRTKSSSHLAYVLYTSGTTGCPKGVMIQHRSVICLLYSRLCDGCDAKTKGSLWTNISFDVSVYEIFSVLLRGGELYILPDEIRLEEKKLFDYIIDKKISSLYLPPFFVKKIAAYFQQHEGDHSVKKILLGVEPILAEQVEGFISKKIVVINAYGPTETTVSSTAYIVEDIKKILGKRIPIGRALNNELTYVLDDYLCPVPIGVAGELYIGGDGLSAGYLNQPELTNERFISNPFAKKKTQDRLYKTGDWVRWTAEGQLEYISRRDFQVKINGLRIELGEIEEALLLHPAIEQCVVVLHDKIHLAAYYTGQPIDSLSLVTFLSNHLPDYLLPTMFVSLPTWPLNANGKLDRAALPRPLIQSQWVAPRNATDAKMVSIWQDILNVSRVGITDDFFELGGDSIASLQLVSRLRYADINCTIKDIFQYRTIARLADHAREQVTKSQPLGEQGLLAGAFGLHPIQQWFFEQSFPVPHHWNQAFLVRVPALSLERLRSLLPSLVHRHDMLRVSFIKHRNNSYEQYYHADLQDSTVNTFTLSANFPAGLIRYLNQCQTGFNLETGPLWQVSYIDGYADGSARLFFTFHHLIVDHVSWRIIVDDMKRLYQDKPLAAKTTSYREWQRLLQQYAETHQNEIDFWLKQVDNTPDNIPRAAHSTQSLIINKNLTAQLTKEAHRAYHTQLTDLLLTALLYALTHVMGEKPYTLTLEGHGRELIDVDASETVGWFTNLYPVRLQTKDTLAETIQHIKDCLRNIPNNGIGYGALSCTKSQQSHLHEKKCPPFYFNYLGQIDTTADMADSWTIVSEETGISIHPDNLYDFLVLINAQIIDGELRINFGLKLETECAKVLIDVFESSLNDIITHCTQQIAKQQFAYTPGDFRNVNSEADLYTLPIYHDKISHYHPFEMTSIQKAYCLGRKPQFEMGNIANHVYAEFSFPQLDTAKLERALNHLIAAHPSLRTVFNSENLTQQYLPFCESMYQPLVVSVFETPYQSDALFFIRNRLSHLVYDVSTYPLFHFCVSQFQDRAILHMSFDLLLLDAQGRMKFFTELTHLYNQENYVLPANSITFRDYQCYMTLLKSSAWYQADKKYWQEKLSHLPLRPTLPWASDPSSIKQPHFTLSQRLITASVWKKFKQKADYYGVSYASVLLSLYGFVLSRFSETPNFLITMTLFHRYGIHPEVNNLWGDFTSTNLFAFSRKEGNAFDFFKTTHDQLWDDIAHALYTGLDVQRDLMSYHQLEPTLAISPIIFTCVVGETQNRTQTLPYFIQPDEKMEERYWIGQTSQAWIDLQATERDGCFSSGWLYVSTLFYDGFIDKLNECYCGLIEYLAENDWQITLPKIALTLADTAIIQAVNAARQETYTATLVSLFEQQAALRAEAAAVIDVNGTTDYHTLQQLSRQLAARLQHQGGEPHQLIAVLCEKGVYQVIATLGILMAGAAYLPLNVEWPLGRIKDILVEGNVSLLLVSETQWEIIKDTSLINEYTIYRIKNADKQTDDKPYFAAFIKPEDIAYVIFTSGSTGKPKGVCISHAGAVNTLLTVNQRFGIHQDDVVFALSDLSFDLSVYDIFGLLAAGGLIVFPDQTLAKEPAHWFSLMKKHKVTVWNSVPQLMQLLLDDAGNDFTPLRLVLLSGDKVPVSLVTQIKTIKSPPAIVSLGGATEASIWSIWYEITDVSTLLSIPYGFPMPNQTIHVLNAFGEQCPIGIAGEIHIGGQGLALCYWQDFDKTKLRFISHEELGRLYKTGDSGKWHPAGYVEFLGRQDNQVKRNGNRVELDEIASKLIQIKGIDNALVRIQNDKLIAYLVSTEFKSNYAKGFDVEKFKLTQQGLRNDLTDTYRLENYAVDEAQYRKHKSYRQFSTEVARTKRPLCVRGVFVNHADTQKALSPRYEDLAFLLTPLRAKTLSDKILPKYLYPSAGSAYAVQCYVHLPSGCYYYHPLLHVLQRVEDRTVKSVFCFEFVAYRPAIFPLYGQDWLRMAYIELGHMIYLLADRLNQKNIHYQLALNEEGDTYYSLATLILNANSPQPVEPEINTIIMQKKDHCFSYLNRTVDLNQQTFFMQTQALGAILKSAQALVVFEGKNTPPDWTMAGYTAAHYMAYWHTQKLVCCPLGFRPFEQTIYALALGKMRCEDEGLAESHAADSSFSDVLSATLSQHLPCYMVPQSFITLDSFPLTANGKIDFQQLPMPDGNTTVQFIAPSTALEKIICTVWQDVLGLTRVGLQDDFFKLGGDSILSIHVTTKLRQQGIHCNVLAIFEYRTIERLMPHIETEIIETAMELSHVDISDELLNRLQLRYQQTPAAE